jgi:signal transduction histidine kinase
MTPTSAGGAPGAPSPWSMRRRLRQLIVALSLMVVLLVVVAVALLISVRHQQQKVIGRYFTAVNMSNQRFIDQIDAETAVRGYALTAQPGTLQPFRQFGSAAYRHQLRQLRDLLTQDGTARRNLSSWEAASNTWYRKYAQPTIRGVKAHGRGSITPQSVVAGKALFDANRSRFTAYLDRLVAEREAASGSLKLRTTLLFVAVLFAALSILAAGGALWVGLRRWVVDPLASLAGESRQVAGGDLRHEVTAAGPTEIRELGTDVEGMRREIVRRLAEVEGARAEIEAAREILVDQAEELARSNRDLEQFAYVASHDLQEPLRKVTSFCQMLDRRYSGQLDERADQYIAFAVDGAKRMQQLINDLLSFSRVGRISEGMVPVDLADCFAAAMSNLDLASQAAEAIISCDPLPEVLGERSLLVQLFQNLVGNAIKFRGEAVPRIHIGVAAGEDEWVFSCVDNGIGIEPQYADRIFVIFQRLHAREDYAGTGIGLALCKRIVEHHGGQLWLDTSVTSGTTFRWTLPVPAADVGQTTDASG